MSKMTTFLHFLDLVNGGLSSAPASNGVYLKTLVTGCDDAMAYFPTTRCITIFGGKYFHSEMKLNIYKKKNPDYDSQTKNLSRVLEAIGCRRCYATGLFYATDAVAKVTEKGIFVEGARSILYKDYILFDRELQLHADAIMTNEPDTALIMYAADCPTAFIHDKKTGAICVLHSMWKGLVIEKEDGMTSIVEAAVRKMCKEYETRPENLEVTIYPCIGLNQFDVDYDVVSKFKLRGLDRHIYSSNCNRKAHIDLTGAMRELFERSGVPHEAIAQTIYRTSDYGFNSLRMAPKNFGYRRELYDGSTLSSVEEINRPVDLDTDQEIDESRLATNALNFLIAVKH